MDKVQTSLFDQFGRCVPGELSNDVHRETRRYFVLDQPKIDYEGIYRRTCENLSAIESLSVGQFKDRVEKILTQLGGAFATKNILNGVWVPFILPKAKYSDIGSAMKGCFLPAIERSLKGKYSETELRDCCNESLNEKLTITDGSRHESLIKGMNHEDVIGCYFPCLTEYSVPAAIEKVQQLPEKFLLAGGYDTAAALIGSPELLFRADKYPPLLWLSAISGDKKGVDFHFESYGYNLAFNQRAHFDRVAESWACGLVVLG